MFTFSLLLTGFFLDTPFLCEVSLKPECAVACVNNANCSSFFYDANTQECYLEKNVYVSGHKLQNRSGVQYYTVISRACPSPYIYCRTTNQCLRMYASTSVLFPEAEARCRVDSGHLVYIKSEDENRQVAIIADNQPVWLGLQRNANGPGWHWSNGNPLGTYTNWGPGKPDDGSQIYLFMSKTGFWDDLRPTQRQIAVCEIDVE
ncbi:lithostathine-1-beta-like [Haliotis rubra]|uniref:lithostathine-1-beta-like n=1 Tax=Haliotis rubra TaxID=36100 RepID=UPI001EE51B71|nr:lithostathine-1-beta-like [Haliotis rubra]